MLTRHAPTRACIEGTECITFYVPAGDPVGFRHMCEPATMALTEGSCKMEPMDESQDVEVFIIPACNMTARLRVAIKAAQTKRETI